MRELFNQLEDYLESREAQGHAKGTLCINRIYIRQFLDYVYRQGRKKVQEIRESDIQSYQTYLAVEYHKKDGEPLRQITIHDKLLRIKQFFGYLQREGIIYIDPAEGISMPKRARILPRTVLNEDEVMRLIEQPDMTTVTGFRDRTILEVLYSTGIRRQELVHLNINDIDLQKGLVRIHQGKNRKDRIIPIGKMACKFVSEYIKKSRPWLKGYEQTEALFIKEGGERLTGIAVRALIQRCAGKAKIKRHVTVHGIRHTCATHLIKTGPISGMYRRY